MENFDLLNDEKVKYVEGKAAECYTYLMESRDILLREAHTTINWLFAVIVGATGYLLKLLESPDGKWPLIIALAVVGLAASWQSLKLFRDALRSKPVIPAGNHPKNLFTDELMACEIHEIRYAETELMQERLNIATEHNRNVGDAINHARMMLSLLPVAGGFAAVLVWLAVA